MADQELVMVVPRKVLFKNNGAPQGFFTEDVKNLVSRIYESYRFVPRPDAENNEDLKQIIPYPVLTYEKSVFLLKRLDTQDEKRLRNLFSIGVGGHINPMPYMTTGIIEKSLRRELNEELSVTDAFDTRLVGYINDDSNGVGRVHFGLVYHVVSSSKNVEVREKDLMSGSFASVEDVRKAKTRMETWSRLLVDHIGLFTSAEIQKNTQANSQAYSLYCR
jgi:predicted NUDIX family phosphoesterase